ncbi:YihY/virulence factor BrkB family protein, partial [Streptomyces spiramenti]|uniref:YihY/virulence factor BrkB family protein n=1 Tax=Streptomyces spiramenti TaxID=2720606 RepID=UPI001FD79ABC
MSAEEPREADTPTTASSAADPGHPPGASAPEGAGQGPVRQPWYRRAYPLALARTPARMWNDDITDWAAALTYYAILAVFPPLLVAVSVMSITGTEFPPTLIHQLNSVVPNAAHGILEQALRDMTDRHSAAWLLAIMGTAGSLWFASSYLAVFRRALHTMHGTKDVRPPWVTAPRILAGAMTLLALLFTCVVVVLVSGELSRGLGRLLGMDTAAIAAWNVVKWPLLLCLATVLVLVLFRTGPPATRGLRRNGPGGALAVVLWLALSVGFAVYASLMGTFTRIYGSLAGIIVFLIWLWLSNLALLTGAQFNAELDRIRHPRDDGLGGPGASDTKAATAPGRVPFGTSDPTAGPAAGAGAPGAAPGPGATSDTTPRPRPGGSSGGAIVEPTAEPGAGVPSESPRRTNGTEPDGAPPKGARPADRGRPADGIRPEDTAALPGGLLAHGTAVNGTDVKGPQVNGRRRPSTARAGRA